MYTMAHYAYTHHICSYMVWELHGVKVVMAWDIWMDRYTLGLLRLLKHQQCYKWKKGNTTEQESQKCGRSDSNVSPMAMFSHCIVALLTTPRANGRAQRASSSLKTSSPLGRAGLTQKTTKVRNSAAVCKIISKHECSIGSNNHLRLTDLFRSQIIQFKWSKDLDDTVSLFFVNAPFPMICVT